VLCDRNDAGDGRNDDMSTTIVAKNAAGEVLYEYYLEPGEDPAPRIEAAHLLMPDCTISLEENVQPLEVDDAWEEDDDQSPLTQIALLSEIWKILDTRFGIQILIPRHMNATITAANTIIDELAQPYRPATPGMGLDAWIQCDDRGLSSTFMARILGPEAGFRSRDYGLVDPIQVVHYPHDPGDFGRCVGLLDAEPTLRVALPKMAEHGQVWAALVAAWGELEGLVREEKASGTGLAPKTAQRLREVIEAAEKKEQPCER
jgi:hypothetical protein